MAKSSRNSPQKQTGRRKESVRLPLTSDGAGTDPPETSAPSSLSEIKDVPADAPFGGPVQVVYFPAASDGKFVLSATGAPELTNEEREFEQDIRVALPDDEQELDKTLTLHRELLEALGRNVWSAAGPVNSLLITCNERLSTSESRVVELKGLFSALKSLPSVGGAEVLVQDLKLRYGCDLGTHGAFVAALESNKNNINISNEFTRDRFGARTTGMDSIPPRPTAQESPASPGPPSVAELLDRGISLDAIREHIRRSFAPTPEAFASALNRWLTANGAPERAEQMGLAEKQDIAEFLTLIGQAMQRPLFWRGEECRVTAFKADDYAPGYLRVRAPGASRGFTKANLADILKEAPFGFDRESSLPPANETTPDPSQTTGDEAAGANWSAKEAKRKSQVPKKKPRR